MLSKYEEKVDLPAEWEPQSAVLIAWPFRESDWKEKFEDVEKNYLALCKAICAYQKVLILCKNDEHRDSIKNKLELAQLDNNTYSLIIADYNDTWCRDYGPLTVRHNGTFEIKNFVFDGWGNKFPAEFDNLICRQLKEKGIFGSFNLHNYDLVLEGGSIDSDGCGSILTTSSCLLKRHADKNKNELEQILKEAIGARKILWLEHGRLTGDDTDGHVDMLARFINEETIFYCRCDDKDDPDYVELQLMEEELALLRQQNDKLYHLVSIPLPQRKYHNGRLLAASYINFLIINHAVLVPQFDDEKDQIALDTFKEHFPDRDIVGIDSNALITQGGSLHCSTMQIPAGVL